MPAICYSISASHTFTRLTGYSTNYLQKHSCCNFDRFHRYIQVLQNILQSTYKTYTSTYRKCLLYSAPACIVSFVHMFPCSLAGRGDLCQCVGMCNARILTNPKWWHMPGHILTVTPAYALSACPNWHSTCSKVGSTMLNNENDKHEKYDWHESHPAKVKVKLFD